MGKIINQDWVKQIQNRVNTSPIFQLQQMSISKIGWGTSLLEINLGPQHLQTHGSVHGGVFATLLDATGFWAVYSQAPANRGMSTIELSINYHASAMSGKLFGTGECIKIGKTLGVGQALIKNETGLLLASGKITVMLLKDAGPLEKKMPKISKFF